MQDAVRNLIFTTILLFSISYDSFVTGVNYDKKYKLHPEISNFCDNCCWFSAPVYEYGKRWMRLGQTSFALGILVSFSTFTAAIKQEKPQKIISILEENT